MILVCDSSNKLAHLAQLNAMFRLRYRVFHELLQWDVSVEEGWEIDDYDQNNPIYVLSLDPTTRAVRGALRLLPTSGPNMLNDTFPVLLGGKPPIHSDTIWESSRFCIDPEISQNRGSNHVTIAAAELMCGVGALSLAKGIHNVVTVTDVFLERMFRRMGCPGTRIGNPVRIGTVDAVAIDWPVTQTMLSNMKVLAGIDGDILAPLDEQPVSVAA